MAVRISLHKLLVFAPDLQIALHFYGEVLGLRLTRAEDNFLSFQGDNLDLIVFACDTPTQPDGHSHEAGSCIAFAVQSLEASVEELSTNGVRFLHSSPEEGPFGRYVAFVDPFGTVHELVEPLP